MATGIGASGPRGARHSPWRWVPLLDGAEADRALRLVEAITADLSAFEAGHPAAFDDAGTLGRGRAGLALFHLCRSAVLADAEAEAAAVELLNTAINDAAALPEGPDLFGGLAGLGFAIAQAAPQLGTDPDDLLCGIDSALISRLGSTPWNRHFDLISGVVGIGVYALARLPSEAGQQLVAAVVSRLAELVSPQTQGLAWLTPPRLLAPQRRPMCPQGCYDLGIAHGIAGIIAFLARTVARGVDASPAPALLDGALEWLLAQESDNPDGRFPCWVIPGTHRSPPARAAWCYGDPGVAVALHAAADAIGDTTVANAAQRVGHSAARRTLETTGVVDAGICHGAAGLAHLFSRLHQTSCDPLYADVARSWYRWTLDFAIPGHGVGGYRVWEPSHETTSPWRDEPGVLDGAAGVGLVLLAATTPIDPAWDQMLLLS